MREPRPFWYLRRRDVGSEVDEELGLHLELRIAELVAEGQSPEEARRLALHQFGDLEATRRYCRRQDEERENAIQRSLLFREVLQDFRIGIRSLLRAPLLSATIVATVGLGLGASAAIFSAVNAAILRPLPYAQPDRLVRIFTDAPPFEFRFSVADYLAFAEQQTRFEGSATFTDRTLTYATRERAELVRARVVSWQFFSVLGISPRVGRDFTEDDGRPGSPPAAIASHAFWRQRLGGQRDAVGEVLRLDGADYRLIGVLPPSDGPLEGRHDLFLIQQFTPPTRRGPFFYSVIARLAPGADRAHAASELRAINQAIFPVWQSSYQDDRATWGMEDLRTNLVGDVGALAGLALAAVGLVWLIACANASSLLVARVTSRRADLAVRSALGASRARLLRHLLSESAVLAGVAAALGLAVAWAGVRLLQSHGAAYLPRAAEIRFDGATVGLVVLLAASSAVLFGVVPALQAAGGAAGGSGASSRTMSGGLAARRLRRALVAIQFAIATPLLVASLLLLTSLHRLGQVDPGFDSARVLTGSIRLPAAQYTDGASVGGFWDELERRVAALPGIEAVAFSDGLPPDNVGNFNNFDLELHPTPPGESQPVTPWVAVTPGYVRTLGLELLEGRLLDERDAQQASLLSVMVDRAWARRFFPGESALGKRFREGGCTTCPWTTVVGVVSEAKYAGVDRPDEGTVYTPLTGATSRFIAVRTEREPHLAATPLRRVVGELEPAAPLTDVASMERLLSQSLVRPRSLSLLVASFAVVALLLSAIGICGIMVYYVQQHRREVCIRMALGGSRSDVARQVIGHGMGVVGLGLLVGLALALSTTRLMSSLLFSVGALDPLAYASAGGLLFGVATVACAVPALRAMGLQPAAVLRNE